MPSLDRNLRRDLENAVKKARRVAETGARAALVALRVGDGRVPAGYDGGLRRRLRAHGRQLGDRLDERTQTQSIERLKDECAYQHWHRLLFARFLAENELLLEPESEMALSLAECRQLAREQNKDWLVLASEFAQRMLPQIFRAGDPVLEIALPPEKRQELEAILEGLPPEVFIADDSLGWVYQFWQADQKDAINKSEHKIGADELPAVTQLFTEDYMVLFLLHNTLGAWWAGKVFAANPDLARTASTEEECRAACAVQGIDWSYLRFVRDGGAWRSAAGTFPGWPKTTKDLTVLDPCMGSGHFLAFALPMLAGMRQAEEGLSIEEAVYAVLRDNLFGLELDPRCTQIAAFNLGLRAWTLAGYRPLPTLNLACAGLGINAPVAAWTALAAGDSLAENAMKQLYELFRQAPALGSLIDPTRVGGELFVAHFDKISSLLSSALASEQSEASELAVVAQGIARAAQLLATKYTLVTTNVPFKETKQLDSTIQRFIAGHFADFGGNLATAFLARLLRFTEKSGLVAAVCPHEWLFLTSYRKTRRILLEASEWRVLADIGEHGFDSPQAAGAFTALLIIEKTLPRDGTYAAWDATRYKGPRSKADALRRDDATLVRQQDQLLNPDNRISLTGASSLPLLSKYAGSYVGLQNGDTPRFVLFFWEVPLDGATWTAFQLPCDVTTPYGGREGALRWESGQGALIKSDQAFIKGLRAWKRAGVAIRQTRNLPATLYTGDHYDQSSAAIIPHDANHLAAIWAFCSSDAFHEAVRRIDKKKNVTNATFVKIPFDIEYWSRRANDLFPHGLPAPTSTDATQWLFSGHPLNGAAPLQVAVARLLGYLWPRQTGYSFMDCPVLASDGLEVHADEDGIVCLPSLRGETGAAERLKTLLTHAFATEWSSAKLNELLTGAGFGGKSLDDWLRDGFFEQHCALFRSRPFVWHIWDGRRDGFSALVNYHRLAGPYGEGRRTLEKLTHTYLGDWLARQRVDQKAGVEGADGRVAAAEQLKRELEKILEGEPPYDLFVRWKPLHQQPVGWEPDVNDGVRLNLRPFMTAKPLGAKAKTACILRATPRNVQWDKDRGKEPMQSKADYPWLWKWDGEAIDFAGSATFDGNRWNDLHYSRAAKLAARERVRAGKP